jgi:hypothetical protein
MTIPEVGEIAIHQMYQKNAGRRLGIVDNIGNIGVKEKPWLVP